MLLNILRNTSLNLFVIYPKAKIITGQTEIAVHMLN